MGKFCENCGKEVKQDSTFCAECGTPIKGNKNQDVEQPKEKKGTSIAGFVFSIIGVLTCGFTSLLGLILSIIGLSISKGKGRKDPLAVSGIVISGIIMGLWIFAIIFEIVTAKDIVVEDFSNKTYKEAVAFCDQSPLNCKFSEEFSDTIKKGEFIKQDIMAGNTIKEYEVLNIVYSKGTLQEYEEQQEKIRQEEEKKRQEEAEKKAQEEAKKKEEKKNKSNNSNKSNKNESQAESKAPFDENNINRIINCDEKKITIKKMQRFTKNEYPYVPDGKEWVGVRVVFENESDYDKYYSESDFKLVNGDGQIINTPMITYKGVFDYDRLNNGNLAPGGKKEGYVIYENNIINDKNMSLRVVCKENLIFEDDIVIVKLHD